MKRITIEHIVNSTCSFPDPPIVMYQHDDDFLPYSAEEYRVCRYCARVSPFPVLECEGCGAPMVEE